MAECAQHISGEETTLAAAGFGVQPADTPERLASLHSLPPNQLVAVTRNGHQAWIYADPSYCRCLYTGGPHNFQEYAKSRVQQNIAQTQLQAAQLNATNWDAWQPWPLAALSAVGFPGDIERGSHVAETTPRG